jgi:hypothetical protein
MTRRRGISLVELLVVMTACTVIFTTSAGLIHRMMHADSRARAFYDVERSALRLSRQFRADVHQARNAVVFPEADETGAFLRLTVDEEQTIEYRHRDGLVTRVLAQRGMGPSREIYAFPSYVKLDLSEAGPPRRLVLSLSAEPTTTPDAKATPVWNQYATRVDLQIEAELARNVRYSSAVREELP